MLQARASDSREISSKDQSAVAFDSKYMAEIKSISDRSGAGGMESPTNFRVNEQMGDSVKFSPRKEGNSVDKKYFKFNISAANFNAEP